MVNVYLKDLSVDESPGSAATRQTGFKESESV